ncbi:class I SAM-dependent methyltransferase [Haloferax sp. YSMS24]|uniref:class I SAM-dependent methyltransferase n=1 Tax=Haloferax sp. YSMS24 TaxID=3388425 RepID=UPI00398CC61E
MTPSDPDDNGNDDEYELALPSNIDGMRTVATTYNQIADIYDKVRQRDSADQLLDFIFANVESGSNVLDVGCGTGRPIAVRLDKEYNVCAVDSSQRMIELATENVPPSVELINADIRDIEFDEDQFQAAVMYYVLVNIPREEHRAVLEYLFSVLDDGGYLLFSTGRGDYKTKITKNWLDSGYTMMWSFYDNEIYLDMLEEIGYNIKAGVIDAPHELKTDRKRKHPFIFAQK